MPMGGGVGSAQVHAREVQEKRKYANPDYSPDDLFWDSGLAHVSFLRMEPVSRFPAQGFPWEHPAIVSRQPPPTWLVRRIPNINPGSTPLRSIFCIPLG